MRALGALQGRAGELPTASRDSIQISKNWGFPVLFLPITFGSCACSLFKRSLGYMSGYRRSVGFVQTEVIR